MAVIRTQAFGAVMVLTHDDGTLSSLPRVPGGYQGGLAPDVPDPEPGPEPGAPYFIWPFPLTEVTSEFGPRNGRLHAGIDFGRGASNVRDSPVIASSNGRVHIANRTNSHGGYGNAVVLDHNNGLFTLYGHLNSLDVNVNDQVKQGQKLGGVGNTGASQGIHLHFETHEGGYRWDNSARDPRIFFRKYN